MYQTRIIIAALFLLQSAIFAISAAEPIGSVVSTQGRSFARSLDGKQRRLKANGEIFLNDTVITKANSQVQLLLNDDTSISQGADSEITIDEYLYTPDNAEENATSIKMTKGIFRVITGKITKLNPDRFHVRTSKATIGIRGCDVLVRINPDGGYDVLVIDLHGFESVVVQTGSGAEQKSVDVRQGARVVTVAADGTMTERPMTPAELQSAISQLSQESTTGTGSGNDNNDDVDGDGNDVEIQTEGDTTIITIPEPYPGQEI
jgi:hypothetical protein